MADPRSSEALSPSVFVDHPIGAPTHQEKKYANPDYDGDQTETDP